MKKDGVNAAFDIVLEEVDKIVTGFNAEIQQKTQAGKYRQAQAVIQTCERLVDFRGEVAALRAKWKKNFRRDEQKPVLPRRPQSAKQGFSKLVVVFPETGERFDDDIAADTFAAAINRMGVERAKALGLKMSGQPLIAEVRRADRFGDSHRKVGRYYVACYSSTARKKMQLAQIAKALGIQIKVTVISR